MPVKFDTLSRGFGLNLAWSPDSRWITYTKPLKSWYSAVFVYSVEDGKVTQITDGLSDAGHPVFDASGKYLYFTASTDVGPRVFGFDMSSYPHRSTRSVYVCVLKKDLPSPLAPESDDEKSADEKKDEKKDDKSSDKAAEGTEEKKDGDKADTQADKKADTASKPGDKKTPPKVEVDFDNISQRILALPIPARDYVALAAGKANMLFVAERPTDAGSGPGGATLHKFDLEKRKLDKVLDKINALRDLSQRRKDALPPRAELVHRFGLAAGKAWRRQAEDGRDGSVCRSSRGVEADVPRDLAY